MSKKYDLVDVFRVFAAISVVFIHSWPLASYSGPAGVVLVSLSRYAVPFFFIVTGFFISGSLEKKVDSNEYFGYLKKYILRIFALYLVWWVIYIPITAIGWSGVNQFSMMHGYELLWKILKAYFLNFFLSETFVGSWYLSVTMLGVSLLFTLKGLKRELIGSVSLVLLVGIIVFGNYGKLLLSDDALIKWIWFRQNVMVPSQSFLTAVPLLYIGHLIKRFESYLSRINVSLLLLLLVFFSFMLFKENLFWIRLGGQFENDELFSGVVYAIVLMLIGINVSASNLQLGFAKNLRQFSSFMYLSQFGLIIGLKLLNMHYQVATNSMTRQFIIQFSIISMFVFFKALSKKYKKIEYLW